MIEGRENKLRAVRLKHSNMSTRQLRLLAKGPKDHKPVRFTAPARSQCPMPFVATLRLK